MALKLADLHSIMLTTLKTVGPFPWDAFHFPMARFGSPEDLARWEKPVEWTITVRKEQPHER